MTMDQDLKKSWDLARSQLKTRDTNTDIVQEAARVIRPVWKPKYGQRAACCASGKVFIRYEQGEGPDEWHPEDGWALLLYSGVGDSIAVSITYCPWCGKSPQN